MSHPHPHPRGSSHREMSEGGHMLTASASTTAVYPLGSSALTHSPLSRGPVPAVLPPPGLTTWRQAAELGKIQQIMQQSSPAAPSPPPKMVDVAAMWGRPTPIVRLR